jgi:signal transduction histidine kinase
MIGRLGIRVRLVGGGVIIALIAAMIAGLVMDDQIQRVLLDGSNSVLTDEMEPYADAIRAGDGDSPKPPGPTQLIGIVEPDGSFALSTLPRSLAPEVAELTHTDATSRFVATDDYSVRVEKVRGHGGVWQVIAARSRRTAVLNGIRGLLLAGFALLVVLVGVAAWLLTTASLTPVRRLRRTARRLSSEASDELLPVPPSHDDIADLATTLNDLVLGLRSSADRERQLVADASHELRTPIAILRTQVDLALAEPGLSPEIESRLNKGARQLGPADPARELAAGAIPDRRRPRAALGDGGSAHRRSRPRGRTRPASRSAARPGAEHRGRGGLRGVALRDRPGRLRPDYR